MKLRGRNIAVHSSEITFEDRDSATHKKSINLSDIVGVSLIDAPYDRNGFDLSLLRVKIYSTAPDAKGTVQGTTYDVVGFYPEYMGNDQSLADIVDVLSKSGFTNVASGSINARSPYSYHAHMVRKDRIDKVKGADNPEFTSDRLTKLFAWCGRPRLPETEIHFKGLWQKMIIPTWKNNVLSALSPIAKPDEDRVLGIA